MLLLFPLTLAYVIVVERALDVGVVIRQGVQYALATRAVRLVQVGVTGTAIFYAVTLAQSTDVNRPRRMTYLALAVAVGLGARRGAEHLRVWVDRRFFREVYSAENVLSDLADKVRTIVEAQPLLETVASHISNSLHVDKVAVLLSDEGRFVLRHAVGLNGAEGITLPDPGNVINRLRASQHAERVYLDDPENWPAPGQVPAGELDALRRLSTQLLLPLSFRNRLLGILSLGPKRSEQPYSNSDIRVLQSVAAQTGLALENSRLTEQVAGEVARRELLRREVAIAREVQQRLFPHRLPAVPGIDYAGACRPAFEIGGDYYDFFELADGRFAFAVGDVSGKGIPAALLMASLRASLRGQALTATVDLASLMANVNRLIYDSSPRSHFATVFFACYDPGTRRLSYVNAGHIAPLLLRCNGSGHNLLRLSEHGLGAGLTREARYAETRIPLHPGDLLVAFTDGVTESMNAGGADWGEDHLLQTLPAVASLSAKDVLGAVLSAAEAHAAGAPQHDDMTLVVMRVASAVQ